jgi:kinetochor protein Mis14/NSL1
MFPYLSAILICAGA